MTSSGRSIEGEVEKISGTRKKLHDLDCTILKRGERSVFVLLHQNGRKENFPLSQVEISPKGKAHTIAVPEWLLIDRGLV